jgi:hypothetical protein
MQVLTWMVLGAVLEPTHYLPYATAAAALLLFSGAKGSTLVAMYQATHKAVGRAVTERFAIKAQERMCKLRGAGETSNNTPAGANVHETKALRLVDSDSTLAGILARCKSIDLKTALGLATGNQRCVHSVAKEFGMNRDVLAAVISAARRDSGATLRALHDISGTTGASGKTLEILFRLSEKQNERALRNSIKEAILFRPEEQVTKSAPDSNLHSHEIEAIVSLGRGRIGRIVDVLAEISEADQRGSRNGESISASFLEPAVAIDDESSSGSSDGFNLHALSVLLELVKNDGMEFQKIVFAKDWVNVCANVCDMPTIVARGLSDLYKGQLRTAAANNVIDALGCDSVLARLVMAVACGSSDNVRLYGPGSEHFRDVLARHLDVEIPTRELGAFLAVARGALLDVEDLAENVGLHDDVCESLAHAMAESEGLGNIYIGLTPEEGATHLQWLSDRFNVEPTVFLGLLCVASNRGGLGESAVAEDGTNIKKVASTPSEFVEQAVSWFVARTPSDMDIDEFRDIVRTSILLWSSKDKDEVLFAAGKLLCMAVGLDAPGNTSTNQKKTGRGNRATRARRSGPERFAPIALLARGFIEPHTFFERHGEVFGLRPKHLALLKAQDWNFVNSKGRSESFTQHTWQEFDVMRVATIRRIAKFVSEKLLTVKRMKRSALRAVRGLLLMEDHFPKIFEEYLGDLGMTNEMIRSVSSFAMLSCEHLVSVKERQKMVSVFSRLLGVPPDALHSGLLAVCHEHAAAPIFMQEADEHEAGVTLERVQKSACLRRGLALVQMARSFEYIPSDVIERMRDFIDSFDLIQAECRKTKAAHAWLSDQLEQPRILGYVISRNHEPGFGASSASLASSRRGGGELIDKDLHFEIQQFLAQMEVTNASMIDCIEGLCLQSPERLGSFAPFVGLGVTPQDIVLACQLFGDVAFASTIGGLCQFFDLLVSKAGKTYRAGKHGQGSWQKANGAAAAKRKVNTRWFQPSPSGTAFQLWNILIAVLAIFYAVVVPLDLLGYIQRGGSEWLAFDISCDVIFLLDIAVSFVTPYFDSRQGRYVVNLRSITQNYIGGWLLPDLLTSVPTTLISLAITAANRPVWFLYVRMLKMLRLIRAFRIIKSVAKNRKLAKLRKQVGEFGPLEFACALTKLAGESNEPLEFLGQGTARGLFLETLPSDVLSSAVDGLPKSMLRGLLDVHHQRQQEVKECIITMTQDGSLKSLDEATVRGLTSLATGEVDGIEDVAEALGFDPDIAEGLAFLASSVTINIRHAQLSASNSLNKLANRLGVDMQIVASLLAIVNTDHASGNEIIANITMLNIDGRYLTSIMAAYSDDTPESPQVKTDAVIDNIEPLRLLYAPSAEDDVFGSLVRLVQGDVTVVRGLLAHELGWSRRERNTVCALILVGQHQTDRDSYEQPKKLDFDPSENTDWDATRNALAAARMIARVLGVEPQAVFTVVAACHGHSNSLATVADLMGFGGDVKKVKAKLQAIAGCDPDMQQKRRHKGGGATDHSDEDDSALDDNDDSSISSGASSVASEAFSVMSAGARDDLVGSGSPADEMARSIRNAQTLSRFTEALNEKYNKTPKAKLSGSCSETDEAYHDANDANGASNAVARKVLLNETTVDWLIHLCYGDVKCRDWSTLQDFVRKMRQRERDNAGNPAVVFRVVQELLALALGHSEVWGADSHWFDTVGAGATSFGGSSEQDLSGFETDGLESKAETTQNDPPLQQRIDEDTGSDEGLFVGGLGFKREEACVAAQFITMFGEADANTFYLENSDGVISSKIYPDTRIVASLASLAANDIETIDRTLPVLCAVLATDVDAVRSLLSLALGDTTRLSHEVSKVARRCGGNVTLPFALGFCAGASVNAKEMKEMLSPLCNQLNLDATLASSIVLATQCVGTVSREAWQTLCSTALMELHDEDGIVTDAEREMPRFWLVDAVAALLAQDPVAMAPHLAKLDALIGFGGLWAAVYESGSVLGAREPPAKLGTLSSVLYAIANNDMNALPDILQVLGMGRDPTALQNVVTLVSVFNRQFSSAELNALENTLQSQDKHNLVPRGALTAIMAALVGDLDQFAFGIREVTKSCGSSGHEGNVFKHIDGFPELLVSMARSDGHGDLNVFQQIVHLVSHQAQKGHVQRSHTILQSKSSDAARTACYTERWRRASTVKAQDELAEVSSAIPDSMPRRTASNRVAEWNPDMKHIESLAATKQKKLLAFIYAVLVGDITACLQTIDVFGFPTALAVSLAALADTSGTRTVEVPEEFVDDPFRELISRLRASPTQAPTPTPVFADLLCILSAGYGSLGAGRLGVSVQLQNLASNYLNAREMQVLDAVFLAQIDAASHTERIINCVPVLLRLMNLYVK